MDNPPQSCLLSKDALLATLRDCVDQVFETMVASVQDGSLERVAFEQPRADSSIRYRDLDNQSKSELVDQQVTISFCGDASGQVVLRCSADAATRIARGLLMMEEGATLQVDEIQDALGECANMLAGLLKTKALDPVGKFQLGIPSFSEPLSGDMGGALVYRVADGVVSLEIWLS